MVVNVVFWLFVLKKEYLVCFFDNLFFEVYGFIEFGVNMILEFEY